MQDFRYGLCCISLQLNSKFQKITRKKFLQLSSINALELIQEKSYNNIKTSYDVAKYCLENNYCYRISSDIFPLISLKEFKDNYCFDDALTSKSVEYSKKIAALVDAGLRISIHPDQFNVLGSENPQTVENTINTLFDQSRILSLFGGKLSYDSPINLHMNCSKGNIQDIADRFLKNFDKLPDDVKCRFVLENEDKGVWSVDNLYKYIYKVCNIPITFDYLHHKCNPGSLTEKEAFELAYSTWGGRKPLFHYSESLPNQNNPRKHADYPVNKFVLYNNAVDVDMEFKHKDLAIQKYIRNI